MEKRWHTSYQTVCETVNKQVTKTCYRDECKTLYRTCGKTGDLLAVRCRDVVQNAGSCRSDASASRKCSAPRIARWSRPGIK